MAVPCSICKVDDCGQHVNATDEIRALIEAATTETCHACDGSGRVDDADGYHEKPCPGCDGRGVI